MIIKIKNSKNWKCNNPRLLKHYEKAQLIFEAFYKKQGYIWNLLSGSVSTPYNNEGKDPRSKPELLKMQRLFVKRCKNDKFYQQLKYELL